MCNPRVLCFRKTPSPTVSPQEPFFWDSYLLGRLQGSRHGLHQRAEALHSLIIPLQAVDPHGDNRGPPVSNGVGA